MGADFGAIAVGTFCSRGLVLKILLHDRLARRWLLLHEELVRPMERLHHSFKISVAYLRQLAAEAAFGARYELEAVRRRYARNRTYLLEYSYRKSATQTFIRRAAGAMPYWPLQQRRGSRATTGLDFDRPRSSHVAALVCGLV